MTAPDLVYIVRPGDDNDELRYSLRSVAANLPHGKVWIVGTVPSWVRNVVMRPLPPAKEKFTNQRKSLTHAVDHLGLSDPFVLMNDDHFVIEPIEYLDDQFPTFHLGPLSAFLRVVKASPTNTWRVAITRTGEWMATQGVEDALAYEAHVPLLFHKQKLADVLDAYPSDQRFAAGMTYEIAGAGPVGTKVGNAKVRGLDALEFGRKLAHDMPFISTNDDSFARGMVGEWIRKRFPESCEYEVAL